MQYSYLSHCKINLGLEILSKRDDGYHNINTVFYKLNEPYDELIVEDAVDFHFTTKGHNTPNDENNMVVKAITMCAEFLNFGMPKLGIHLRKNIPSGAGLGGGSANAASAIRIFSERCKKLSQEEMFAIAKKLGADVPFFLFHADAAVAAGIGDKLLPINLKIKYPILVIRIKDTFISTAKAYSLLRLTNRTIPTNFSEIVKNIPEPIEWRNIFVNDFEGVAFAIYPILFSLKRSLYDFGAEFALMSGSGSALFAIFKTQRIANNAREKLLTDYPETSVFISQ